MTTTHTITVKGMNASHVVLATDTTTIQVDTGPPPAPTPTLLTSPHSCGQSWSSHNQEWYIDYGNSTIRSGNDMTRGGGAYVWIEGSGFTSTSQVTNALNTLMPTYNFGYNALSTIGGFNVVWSPTVSSGKLTQVCIDSGYRTNFSDEDDNNGGLIRKSAIAVGNNGVAYFMPSQPVFEWSGIGNSYNRQAGSLKRFQGFATIGEVFQNIRDTNNLASSVDFALVLTYGNGDYSAD